MASVVSMVVAEVTDVAPQGSQESLAELAVDAPPFHCSFSPLATGSGALSAEVAQLVSKADWVFPSLAALKIPHQNHARVQSKSVKNIKNEP